MDDCLFCKIIGKKIPAKFAYEDETLTAIYDINPQAPVHLLVMPKKHISEISKTSPSDQALLGEMLLCANRLAAERKLEKGYRLVINNGAEAGQSVFHIHLHLLGGRKMTWPPG